MYQISYIEYTFSSPETLYVNQLMPSSFADRSSSARMEYAIKTAKIRVHCWSRVATIPLVVLVQVTSTWVPPTSTQAHPALK